MKRGILPVATLVVGICMLAAIAAEGPFTFTGRVVGVHDGDTVRVQSGDREYRVRLHGIDAPELKQPHGQAARDFLAARIDGKEVEVQVQARDRYGRYVAKVFYGEDRTYNAEATLVYYGHAWWYRQYAPHNQTLRAFEASARSARRGLWADANPQPPWEWRAGARERREQRGTR